VEVRTTIRVTGKSTVTYETRKPLTTPSSFSPLWLTAAKPQHTSRVVTYELPLLVEGIMSQGLREQNGCENTGWKGAN